MNQPGANEEDLLEAAKTTIQPTSSSRGFLPLTLSVVARAVCVTWNNSIRTPTPGQPHVLTRASLSHDFEVARQLRSQWLRLMGLSEEEVADLSRPDIDPALNLEYERQNVAAAHTLQENPLVSSHLAIVVQITINQEG